MTRRASQNFLALNVHQRLTFSLSRSSSAIPSISSDREPPTHIIFAMSCTSMSLLSKKSAKPRVERSPSIESCFPARSSAETSGCKSPEDNDISINMEHSHEDIYHEDSTCLDKFDNGISPASYSVKYPIASAVPPEISIPCPSISDFQNSPQQLQNVMNLTTIVEMTGSDAQSIPSSSRRLDSPGYPLMSQSASFPLATVAFSGAISDVALDMIQRYPGLAISRDGNGDTALHVLSRKPAAFFSGSQLGLWQRCIYSCLHVDVPSNYLSSYKRHRKLTYPLSHVVPFLKVLLWKVLSFLVPGLKVIYDKKLMQIQALELVKRLWSQVLLLNDSKIGELIRTPSRLLFTAAELGIVEFVVVLIQSYPDLIWKVDDKSQSIFHIAVAHRQENIFNLIYEIGAHKDLIAAYKDENNNNMLHLAGKLAPPNRLKTDSGAALQLRRELHWFKEVEKIVQPLYTEMRDSEGRTPQFLFTEGHKGLVYEGEKWMKDTASSCMVVATLIATVMFAAAFSVPGGNNDNTGRPIFISKKPFMVFAISDALALFSSATSILMFLSILTSRYAEEDFLDSLPNRLIMGLATLFISIATMMISFCATFFIVLSQGLEWIGVPMALVACVPVILFALLQFPLFVDVISHTYRSSTIFGPRNYLLC
ncbi:uncharacterized protein LOC132303809 isoform X2 [Cornus florida]|uniref:uncharacterized protein LOC132303809 isoform X2 n=1 Tax=Cornus florida TaxID=4283 RepID=UPI00289D254D|nr:uncharacterized protein LOC132303809 isoform X2 [Cornus florida]